MLEKAAGIDMHSNRCDATIVKNNEIVDRKQFWNNQEGAREVLEWLNEHGCKDVAMEVTGRYWQGYHRYLSYNEINVTVAHANAVYGIVKNKSDKINSLWLATLHQYNLLNSIYIPPDHVQKLRTLTRTRWKLVSTQTRIKNTAQSLISTYSWDLSAVYSDTFGKTSMKFIKLVITQPDKISADTLRSIGMKEKKIESALKVVSQIFKPSTDANLLLSLLNDIEYFDKAISELDAQIAHHVRSHEDLSEAVDILITVPGYSLTVAATLACEIGDVTRFPTAQKIASYFGIVPVLDETNEHYREGHISRMGCPHVRRALSEAANSIVMNETPDLFGIYLRIARRKRGKKGHGIALTALAHELLNITFVLLSKKMTYNKMNETLTKSKRRKIERLANQVNPLREKLIDLKAFREELPREIRKELKNNN